MQQSPISSILDNYEKLLKNELDEFDVDDEITRIRIARLQTSCKKSDKSRCGGGFLSPAVFFLFGSVAVLLVCFIFHVHLYTVEVKALFESLQRISESQWFNP